MSQREKASSRLKLQPHIYYVYVYKSLRRPHIPETCKEGGQIERRAQKAAQRRLGAEAKMCEERSGGGVVLAILYLQRGVTGVYYCRFFRLRTCDRRSEISCRVNLKRQRLFQCKTLSGACTASSCTAPHNNARLLRTVNIYRCLRANPPSACGNVCPPAKLPHRPALCSHLSTVPHHRFMSYADVL